MVAVSLHEAVLSVCSRPLRRPVILGGTAQESLDELHLTLELRTADGRRARGVAAEVLAPAWFDPLLRTGALALAAGVRTAAEVAVASAREPRVVYRIWRDTYEAAVALGGDRGLNPLAAGHGAALVERALFDGLGRALGRPYHDLLRRNLGGIDLADIHPELAGASPADVLPPRPAARLQVRHTVGVADILREGELPPREGLDALPESLEACVRRQGLRHFRVDLEGRAEPDGDRLERLAEVLGGVDRFSVVLDGGEAFSDPAQLRTLLDGLESGPEAGRRLYEAIAWVEQPFPRAAAMEPALCREVAHLSRRKPVFIDESDEALGSFKRAAGLGYAGTSVRIGNGLTKALANHALCRLWNGGGSGTGRRCRLAGAELLSLPVIGLHQHLAQMAALGVDPVECGADWHRPGLGHLSPAERETCAQLHGGVYEEVSEERAPLAVRGGGLDLASLNRAPGLGIGFPIDPSRWVPLSDWRPESAGQVVTHA